MNKCIKTDFKPTIFIELIYIKYDQHCQITFTIKVEMIETE